MKIAFYGDSLTVGQPGASFFKMLEGKLSEHELLNYGKGGDTVISLYQRIKEDKLIPQTTLTFLWIGTNDVLAKASTPIKNTLNPPWVKDHKEFGDYYKLTLDLLSPLCEKLITVPPLFIGEDLNNPWNGELKELAGIIEGLSANYSNVEYLDLRKIFLLKRQTKEPSDYIIQSRVRLMMDCGLTGIKEINDQATERGLFFTLDGVHLNGPGATLVADAFFQTTNAYLKGEK